MFDGVSSSRRRMTILLQHGIVHADGGSEWSAYSVCIQELARPFTEKVGMQLKSYPIVALYFETL